MVSRPSYLYNGNPYTSEIAFCIEVVPWFRYIGIYKVKVSILTDGVTLFPKSVVPRDHYPACPYHTLTYHMRLPQFISQTHTHTATKYNCHHFYLDTAACLATKQPLLSVANALHLCWCSDVSRLPWWDACCQYLAHWTCFDMVAL